MKEAFVGFDSAWGGHRAGAIAWAVFEDEVPKKAPPPCLVGFADAAEIIEDLQRECDDVLVAIDQPIVVPNDIGSRPVDDAVDSLMQHLKSRALKANRTEQKKGTVTQRGYDNKYQLGDEAPVWKFMSKIGPCGYFGKTDTDDKRAFVDFQAAKIVTGNTHVIEVYPALALAALNPKFMDRESAARYDPEHRWGNYPFSLDDWKSVCSAVADCADQSCLQELSQWAAEIAEPWVSPSRPRKLDQDKIDAILCLLVAMQWRWQSNGAGVIGDLETGYIVAPTSDETRKILKEACDERGVYFKAVEEYDRLCRLEMSQAPTLGELLLEIPQDDQEFERLNLEHRPLDM